MRHTDVQVGGGIDKGMSVTFHSLPAAVKNYCRLAVRVLHGDAHMFQSRHAGEAGGVVRGGAAVVGDQGVDVFDLARSKQAVQIARGAFAHQKVYAFAAVRQDVVRIVAQDIVARAAVERIRAEDPDFDIKTALADPDFAQMLKLGVKMEDAYKARYFDDIMARKTAETAKKTESGVVERIRQRGARPSENGTNPGGAAVLKTDVSKLTPAQCEELERRAMRGQIITF